MKRIFDYLRREVVLTVALVAAIASFLLVPPGAHTLAGIDTTTLLKLFSLMTIVAGFRHMGAFDQLAGAVTGRIHTLRGLAVTLVTACFLLAMVATNDVALITLVPFTLLLFRPLPDTRSGADYTCPLQAMGGVSRTSSDLHKGASIGHITLAVVLETIAANLGSMVTPIGNPQNLYLYSSGQLGAVDFPALTWPYAVLSFGMLMLCCLFIPKAAVQSAKAGQGRLPARKLGLLTNLPPDTQMW